MEEQPEHIEFRAQLAQRQSSLMLSGQGDRCLIELETFGMDALIALVGMAKFTNRVFNVTIEEINRTKLDDEANAGTEKRAIRVGRRGTRE